MNYNNLNLLASPFPFCFKQCTVSSVRSIGYIYGPNQNNVPNPADISLRESAETEKRIGTKLRMAQYKQLTDGINKTKTLLSSSNSVHIGSQVKVWEILQRGCLVWSVLGAVVRARVGGVAVGSSAIGRGLLLLLLLLVVN